MTFRTGLRALTQKKKGC
jgi:peptidoglycan/xylan/chitin deacetylase (PgdA/CDA1 family)